MVARSLVVRRPIVGVRRNHHLLVAHQVDIEWDVDGQFEDVEDEDICAVGWAGEAPKLGVKHVPQVAVQKVKRNGLVQGAGGKVDSAGRREGHTEGLWEWVQLHGEQGVALRSDRHLHGGDGEGVSMGGVHQSVVGLPVGAAHLGGITPACLSKGAPIREQLGNLTKRQPVRFSSISQWEVHVVPTT